MPVLTGISLCGRAASWTAYVLPEVASSAVTGTDSTWLARACTKLTLTAAWSSPLPDTCLSSVIVTGTELDPPPPPPLPVFPVAPELELWATELTALIVPGTVLPSGIWTVT